MKRRRHELVFWLPLLVFLPFARDFVFLRGAAYSDLTISHLPNMAFLHRSLVETGVVPLWSPAILSGYPFFANPLSGLWYPPGWLAAIWPAAWTFNLLAGLHLVFGAFGMAGLLAACGIRPAGQRLGALAFALMPKLLAHYAAGHVTLVYAVAWTPWLLLATIRPGRWMRPGVALAAVFLADPRWAAYAGALWLAWNYAHRHALPAGRWLLAAGRGALLAVLLAAPLLLPMLEYAARSTRRALTPTETLAFSLEPVHWLGLFLPAASNVEWVLYPGALVLVLAVLAMLNPSVRPKHRFWIWTALAAGLFSMGAEIPLLRMWAELPLGGMLRVPARALFLLGTALAFLAAAGLDDLLDGGPALRRREARIALAALAGVWAALAASPFVVEALPQSWAAWGLAGLAAAALAAAAGIQAVPRTVRAGLVLAFCLFDSAAAWFSLAEAHSPDEILDQGAAAAAWLADQPGRFRVYSPSYSIPQHTAARFGLELADGVDPLQLQAYADFMAEATGVLTDGYSITLPALRADVQTANAGANPDPALLAWLNVRYVAADFDLDAPGLVQVQRFGETRVYENRLIGTARFSDAVVFTPERRDWSPNRIAIEAAGPATLALTEIDYPGWTATGAAIVEPVHGLLRTVRIDAGASGVELVFRPLSLFWGLLLFAAGLAMVIWSGERYGRP